MIVTEEILESGKSINGSWGKAQLKCFGFDGLQKGWKDLIIGKEIPDENVEQFIKLKNAHVSSVSPDLITVLAWDKDAEDFEVFEFNNRKDVDIFCNDNAEETGKTSFVINGEIIAKYYPYRSKRKGNL